MVTKTSSTLLGHIFFGTDVTLRLTSPLFLCSYYFSPFATLVPFLQYLYVITRVSNEILG
jgi:hypothetical protein